jgi:hypothetical protein
MGFKVLKRVKNGNIRLFPQAFTPATGLQGRRPRGSDSSKKLLTIF